MKFNSEAEFGKQIVEILHIFGFETWQEVYLGASGLGRPCVDIIAKYNKMYFAFELKLHLNDEVLIQAVRNKNYVDYTFVLVPSKEKALRFSSVKKHYVKSFGLGVYSIDLLTFRHSLENALKQCTPQEVFSKKLYKLKGYICYNIAKRITRKNKKRKKGKLLIETYLFEEQKDCVAGSKEENRTTPFKRSCFKIEEFLKECPTSSKKEVWKALEKQLHWKNYNSMCASFRAWHDKLDCMKNIVFGENNSGGLKK
jgi:hypothetical protein